MKAEGAVDGCARVESGCKCVDPGWREGSGGCDVSSADEPKIDIIGTGRGGKYSWVEVESEIPDGKRTAGESKFSFSFLFSFSSIAASFSALRSLPIPSSISSTSSSSAASKAEALISASHLAISLRLRKSLIFDLNSTSIWFILSCSFSILCCSSNASFLILLAIAFFRFLIEDVVEEV